MCIRDRVSSIPMVNTSLSSPLPASEPQAVKESVHNSASIVITILFIRFPPQISSMWWKKASILWLFSRGRKLCLRGSTSIYQSLTATDLNEYPIFFKTRLFQEYHTLTGNGVTGRYYYWFASAAPRCVPQAVHIPFQRMGTLCNARLCVLFLFIACIVVTVYGNRKRMSIYFERKCKMFLTM